MLIFEARRFEANRFVEATDDAVRVRHEINGRSLMRNEPLAIDLEFIPPGLAAKDRMIFQDQDTLPRPRLLQKSHGRGETTDAATDNDAIVHLAGIGDVGIRPVKR